MTVKWFACIAEGCDHRPFKVSDVHLADAGGEAYCEYCGRVCLERLPAGNYLAGVPVRGDLRSWRRHDLYVPTGAYQYLHVAGKDDVSPLYRDWVEGNYDARCSCCYLGHAHSEEHHRQQAEGSDDE